MLTQSTYRYLSLLIPWRLELGWICRACFEFVNIDYKLNMISLHRYSVHELTLLLVLQCSIHLLSTAALLPSVVLPLFDLLSSAMWHPYWYTYIYVCPDSPIDLFFARLTNIFVRDGLQLPVCSLSMITQSYSMYMHRVWYIWTFDQTFLF